MKDSLVGMSASYCNDSEIAKILDRCVLGWMRKVG